MSNERRQILEMLAAGKISANEAEELLDALNSGGEPKPEPNPSSAEKRKPRFLKIEVNSVESGKPKNVNIRIPLMFIKAGMKLSSFIPGETRARVDGVIKDRGFDICLSELKGQDFDAIVKELQELNIEVNEPGENVRIYCE